MSEQKKSINFTGIAALITALATLASVFWTKDKDSMIQESMFNIMVQKIELLEMKVSHLENRFSMSASASMTTPTKSECESDNDCSSGNVCHNGKCATFEEPVAAVAEKVEIPSSMPDEVKTHPEPKDVKEFKEFEQIKQYVQQQGTPWKPVEISGE